MRGRDDYYSRQQQETEQRRQQETYAQSINDSLYNTLKAFGIDPNDKGIDWAKDATDYAAGRNRFDASISRIVKGNLETERTTLKKELDDWKKKAEIDLGIHSQEPSNAPGSGDSGSDAAFKKSLGDGSLTLQGKEGKVNLERAKSLGLA